MTYWLCKNHAVSLLVLALFESATCSVVSLCNSKPSRLLCPWDSPGKNIRVGSHSLRLGIFPTQGLNLGLLHCRQILYYLSHQGSPTIVCLHTNRNNMIKQSLLVHACLLSCFSHVQLFACPPGSSCPWGFCRQEYQSGLPCPPQSELP